MILGTGIGIGFAGSGGGGAAPATPQTILGSGVKVWLRADALVHSAGAVSQWTDKSGNGNHFTQSTPAAQPTLQATGGPNNQPSVLFDGSDDYLESAGPDLEAPGTTPIYVWIVGRQKTWTSGDRLLTQTGAASIVVYQITATPRVDIFNGSTLGNTAWILDTYMRLEALFNTTSSYLKIGTTEQTGSTGTTDPGAGFRLCRFSGAGSTYGHFELCEVIIYQGTAPTSQQRADLDAYAAARYGPLS